MFGFACNETKILNANADLPGSQPYPALERSAQEWHTALACDQTVNLR
jgi:hypothetical protein